VTVKTKIAVLSALLGLGALPLPASGAPSAPRMQVWEIVRTSWAPSKLAVSLNAGFSDSRTILAMTFLRGGNVLPGAYLSSDEGRSFPEAYAAGERVSCPAAAVCTKNEGYNLATVYYNDNGKSDPVAPDKVIVVTYGRASAVTIESSAKLWKVRKVTRAVRAVWSSDSDSAVGVFHSVAGAEVFTSATLKGGSRGSVAIGVPPCSGAPGVAATLGAGMATLSGGVKPVETVCPRDVARPSQVARKATTWTFSGTVAGMTAELVAEPGTVRLLVVDF
jgi:hypothetical protein